MKSVLVYHGDPRLQSPDFVEGISTLNVLDAVFETKPNSISMCTIPYPNVQKLEIALVKEYHLLNILISL